jgi:mRNA-capping enzyme
MVDGDSEELNSLSIALVCSAFLFNLWMQLPFSDRWKLLEDEIIRPRTYERKQFETGLKGNPSYRYDLELFSVPKSRRTILFTLLLYSE